MKSLLDRSFKYTPAAETNVRKTIRMELRRLERLAEAKAANEQEAREKVSPLKQRVK